MQSIQSFVKFMKSNGIDQTAIQYSANFIQYKHYYAGEYIFKQNDISKHFFGIIKGTVSIVLNKMVENTAENMNIKFVDTSIKNGKLHLVVEEEITRFSAGECFGQWGLIDNKPRSTGALAYEDVDMFLINKETFDFAFKKPLKKSEVERKSFVASVLKLNTLKSTSVFDNFFKNTVAKAPSKGKIIYNKGDDAKTIYLIYGGEFELLHHIKGKSIPKTLLKMGKGSIMGLESLDTNGKFAYSLRCATEDSIIIEIPKVKLELVIGLNHAFMMKKWDEQRAQYKTFVEKYCEEKKRVKDEVKGKGEDIFTPTKSRNFMKHLKKFKLKEDSYKVNFGTTHSNMPVINKEARRMGETISHFRQSTDRFTTDRLVSYDINSEQRTYYKEKVPEFRKERFVSSAIMKCVKENNKRKLNTGKFTFPLVTRIMS